jgi:hypothetical protein
MFILNPSSSHSGVLSALHGNQFLNPVFPASVANAGFCIRLFRPAIPWGNS